MAPTRTHPRAAFFDVDETLLAGKSMVEFLRLWLADRGRRSLPCRCCRATRSGGQGGRQEANLAYYRHFAGVPVADLARAGRRWYAEHRRRPGAFLVPTLGALAEHRAAGDAVVLASGSFQALLASPAEDLGADLVLCTELLLAKDGTLNGEVRRPMIGPAKAEAVVATLGAVHADPAHGDGASDLDRLEAVGNPRVVGDNPILVSCARPVRLAGFGSNPGCATGDCPHLHIARPRGVGGG